MDGCGGECASNRDRGRSLDVLRVWKIFAGLRVWFNKYSEEDYS